MAYTDEFVGSRFLIFYYGGPENNNTFFRPGRVLTRLAMPGTEQETGPVILPQQRIYDGSLRGNSQSGVLYMEAGRTGTIKAMYLHQAGVLSGLGTITFNVRHNLVPLWAGANRMIMHLSQNPVEKLNLSIPVAKGDSLILDMEQKSGGSLTANLVWIVDIEVQ